MVKVFVFLLLFFFSFIFCDVNNRPIIGILAQPTSDQKRSYIAASYVKWIESAGARVVPINYSWSFDKHKDIFGKVNGILFPGGGVALTNTSRYMEVMKLYFDLTVEANKRGDYTPLWATCLGFEAVAILAAKDYSLLHTGFDSWNLSLPLEYSASYKDSKMLGSAPQDVLEILEHQAVTLNNHVAGVTTSRWDNNKNLNAFFKVLSTNKDRKGVAFVSTIEAHDFPIFATQWHPEKVQFEWVPAGINHSAASVRANGYFAFFFVNEARKNSHKFATQKEEWDSLIYHFNPTFTYPQDFTQTYFFN
jgi:gamma-glutamyl hydrolase